MEFTPELKSKIDIYFDNITKSEVDVYFDNITKPGFAEKREKQLINEYCIAHNLIIHEFTVNGYEEWHGFLAYDAKDDIYRRFIINNELEIIEDK